MVSDDPPLARAMTSSAGNVSGCARTRRAPAGPPAATDACATGSTRSHGCADTRTPPPAHRTATHGALLFDGAPNVLEVRADVLHVHAAEPLPVSLAQAMAWADAKSFARSRCVLHWPGVPAQAIRDQRALGAAAHRSQALPFQVARHSTLQALRAAWQAALAWRSRMAAPPEGAPASGLQGPAAALWSHARPPGAGGRRVAGAPAQTQPPA